MNLTLDGLSALTILRALRTGMVHGGVPSERAGLVRPCAGPAGRWSRRSLDLGRFSDLLPLDHGNVISVAVPTKADRLRMKGTVSSVLGTSLPEDAFVPLGDGLSIPCPELLFLEMDKFMGPLPQLMLGLELCGTFSRDPLDPRGGEGSLGIPPLTTASAIRAFAERASLYGHTRSDALLDCLADNAWSIAEALVAAYAALPLDELGHGLGPLSLNERHFAEGELGDLAARESRVPDMLLAGSSVGINYDGDGHLDLNALASAVSELERDPGNSARERELGMVRRRVREKYVDDRRRDRELGAAGLSVFVATKEDLFEEGGLDKLMGECMVAMRRQGVEGMDLRLQLLKSKPVVRRRREMLAAVLPGKGDASPL